MQTYCQPVFVAPFGHVTSIYVVGFHVRLTFAHIWGVIEYALWRGRAPFPLSGSGPKVMTLLVVFGMSAERSWMCVIKSCVQVRRGNSSRSNLRTKGSSCFPVRCSPTPWSGPSGRYPWVAKVRSAICSHPSRMWITVARGESCNRAKKSLALVMGRPCSQVISCMLPRRPSPRIASVFDARSPIPVVVHGTCSFLNVGARSHRILMSSCACVLLCMAPYPTYILCNFA